jgi:8-oxo-dGTP pyrophosphatase MutT (NUDIX family)
MKLSEIKQIKSHRSEVFLDLDGVIADFFGAQAKMAGVPTYRDISAEQNERTLNQMIGTDFFAKLDKLPDADRLIGILLRVFGHYNICSSPLRGDLDNSDKNKRIWISNQLKQHPPKNIFITSNKKQYATQPDGTPNVLIDDRGDNITSWEAAGGVAIKYQADEDGLDVITAGLKRAFDIIRGKIKHVPQQLKSRDRSQGNLIAKDDDLKENDAEHGEALRQTGFWGRRAAGCVFMAMDTGRICIAHRSSAVEQPSTWGTWGGAIDGNEDPAVAVRREVREEAGYSGAMRLIPLYVFEHSSGFRYFNFLALVPHEFEPSLNWETQDSDWFSLDRLPSPLHPGLTKLLSDPASMQTIEKYSRMSQQGLR